MTTLHRDWTACGVCGKTSEQTGIASTHEFGSPGLVLTDLWRRSSQLAEAIVQVEEALAMTPEPTLLKCLLYERGLVRAGDTCAHLVSEALEEAT